MNVYEISHDLADWFDANEDVDHLDEMLRRYYLFRLLREDTGVLSETRELTQQYSLFDETEWTFTEYDLRIVAQIEEYNDYLENPEEYGGEDQPPIPPIPPEKPRTCLIYPGDIETKWKVYRDFADRYVMIVSDIASFNTTIQNFIRVVLSKLEKMNANQYVAAFYVFSIMNGHTRYCDRPSPSNPKYTCTQLGYHFRSIKETAEDNPRSQSLRRYLQRIDRDLSRGAITAEDKMALYQKAKDLFHASETETGTSYETFEQMLQSKTLYPLCGVVRKSKPRGRPKRG